MAGNRRPKGRGRGRRPQGELRGLAAVRAPVPAGASQGHGEMARQHPARRIAGQSVRANDRKPEGSHRPLRGTTTEKESWAGAVGTADFVATRRAGMRHFDNRDLVEIPNGDDGDRLINGREDPGNQGWEIRTLVAGSGTHVGDGVATAVFAVVGPDAVFEGADAGFRDGFRFRHAGRVGDLNERNHDFGMDAVGITAIAVSDRPGATGKGGASPSAANPLACLCSKRSAGRSRVVAKYRWLGRPSSQ